MEFKMQTCEMEKRKVEEELGFLIGITFQMEDELNSIVKELEE